MTAQRNIAYEALELLTQMFPQHDEKQIRGCVERHMSAFLMQDAQAVNLDDRLLDFVINRCIDHLNVVPPNPQFSDYPRELWDDIRDQLKQAPRPNESAHTHSSRDERRTRQVNCASVSQFTSGSRDRSRSPIDHVVDDIHKAVEARRQQQLGSLVAAHSSSYETVVPVTQPTIVRFAPKPHVVPATAAITFNQPVPSILTMPSQHQSLTGSAAQIQPEAAVSAFSMTPQAALDHLVHLFPNVEVAWLQEQLGARSLYALIDYILEHEQLVPKTKKPSLRSVAVITAVPALGLRVLPKGAEQFMLPEDLLRLEKVKYWTSWDDIENAWKNYFNASWRASNAVTNCVTSTGGGEAYSMMQCREALRYEFRKLAATQVDNVAKKFCHRFAPAFLSTKLLIEDWTRQQKKGYVPTHEQITLDGVVCGEKVTIALRSIHTQRSAAMHATFRDNLGLAREKELVELYPLWLKVSGREQMRLEEARLKGEVVECGICFGETISDDLVMCDVGHASCPACLRHHADESIHGQGSVVLRCMEKGCEEAYARAVLERCLTAEQLLKLDEREGLEAVNAAEISDLTRCNKCGFPVVLDVSVDINKVFQCPNCEHAVCRMCGENWDDHFGKPCTEVSVEREGTKLRREFEEKMAEATIRRCHQCKSPLMKSEGCNKLTCRCGAKMCYICRQPNIDYDHFCRHPREPGQGCQVCTQCFLWENAENGDDVKLKELQAEALEAQQAAGVRPQTVGVILNVAQVQSSGQSQPALAAVRQAVIVPLP